MNTHTMFGRVRSPCQDSQRRRRRLVMERLEDRHLLSGVWSTLASMPAPRSSLNAEEVGGQLHVAGGHDGSTGGTTTLFVYDVSTDTWSTGTPMLGRAVRRQFRGDRRQALRTRRLELPGLRDSDKHPAGLRPGDDLLVLRGRHVATQRLFNLERTKRRTVRNHRLPRL